MLKPVAKLTTLSALRRVRVIVLELGASDSNHHSNHISGRAFHRRQLCCERYRIDYRYSSWVSNTP